MRAGRPRAQLRVSLGRDVVRVHVAGQLDELDQLAVRRQSREDQPSRLQVAAELVVDLVAVPVALLDLVRAVGLGHDRP